MSILFDQVVSVAEQVFFDEAFLEQHWPHIKQVYAV